MPFEALEGRIITLEMEGKIVSKKFNDVDSFYISEEEVSEVMPRTRTRYTPRRRGNNGTEIVCFGTVS